MVIALAKKPAKKSKNKPKPVRKKALKRKLPKRKAAKIVRKALKKRPVKKSKSTARHKAGKSARPMVRKKPVKAKKPARVVKKKHKPVKTVKKAKKAVKLKREPAKKAAKPARKKPVRAGKPKAAKSARPKPAPPKAKAPEKAPEKKVKKETKMKEEPPEVKDVEESALPAGAFQSNFNVKIENVVVFAVLGKPVPMDTIATGLEGAEYSPESFPGVVYRIKDPRAASLIFSSGKIVCTGARSVDKAKIAVHKVVDDMRKLGIDMPQKFEINVENIVASTSIAVKGKLNLEQICFSLENAEYEPEQFPGLVYRITDPRVAFLLFGTGKIICTGARKLEEIHIALDKFMKHLQEIGVDSA